MQYILLVVGLALLVKGADWLIEGSTSLAKRLGVPSLLIGLTVVALGTSLPELIINVFSAIRGSTGIAFGNVVGSNLANTLLILGVAALIYPPKVTHSTVWREVPFSFLAAFALLAVANIPRDGGRPELLTAADGLILLFFLGLFILYLYRTIIQGRANATDERMEIELLSTRTTTIYIVLGIIALYLGGDWAVSGAVQIARGFGVSEFLISATIVAFGTSLPELVTSIRASLRQDSDLAVGNVLGSNVFNVFLVLAVTTLITPVGLPASINIDISFLLASSLLLFFFVFVDKEHTLKRWEGGVFLVGYLSYIVMAVVRG